jgi:poly(beta-D-mannuronate) lyase
MSLSRPRERVLIPGAHDRHARFAAALIGVLLPACSSSDVVDGSRHGGSGGATASTGGAAGQAAGSGGAAGGTGGQGGLSGSGGAGGQGGNAGAGGSGAGGGTPPDDAPLPPCLMTIPVSAGASVGDVLSRAVPGDCFVFADGNYTMGAIHAKGTVEHPIVMRAENRGKAVVTAGALEMGTSSYTVFEGFGWTSNGNIKLTDSDHCRVSRCRIQPNEVVDTDWIVVSGMSDGNRIDHNDMGPKSKLSNMVMLSGLGSQVVQHTRIDHNYFHDIHRSGGNGWETIRAGLSGLALSSGFTVIEYNLFKACDGDPETISIKSSDAIVRYNTMRATSGQITLRHGNRTQVYGNFILGDGNPTADGIRVCGQDHKIFNNYLQDLHGDVGILLEGGDSDAMNQAGTAHYRVYRTQVLFNTVVDAGLIDVGGGHQLAPVDCTVADNIVQGSSGPLMGDNGMNTKFIGNIVHPLSGATAGVSMPPDQVKVVDPALVKMGDVFRLSANSPAIDAALGDFAFVADDMDGQPRARPDVGADEWSDAIPRVRALTAADVGPDAP